jgi:ABC-2 type transport system permease protein
MSTTNVTPDSRINRDLFASPFSFEPYLWSVRRELWEYRSAYYAPLIVAGFFVLGYFISVLRTVHKLRASGGSGDLTELIVGPYNFAGLAIMGATFLFSIYYCFDALHSERRDRSVLFWKSLPVSDLTVVLAKATIPIVFLPVLTVGITIGLHCLMLAIGTAVFAASGLGGVLSNLPLITMWTTLLYHMVAMHALAFAPLYAWMLLISAWARRAPFLWGTLPILIVAALEKIAFNTTHFLQLIGSIVAAGPSDASFPPDMVGHSLSHLHPGAYLFSPSLWIGLTVAAAFLIAAARIRRHRGPN